MANIGKDFKDIFLAGIGAMAVTAEKGKDLVEQLVQKGEMTVAQGSKIKEELRDKGDVVVSKARYSTLEAAMKTMSEEQREDFIAKAREFADKAKQEAEEKAEQADADAVQVDVEIVSDQEQGSSGE